MEVVILGAVGSFYDDMDMTLCDYYNNIQRLAVLADVYTFLCSLLSF